MLGSLLGINVRAFDRGAYLHHHPCKTVTSRDAGHETTGMYLQRVLQR
jgi:hypothetical protein